MEPEERGKHWKKMWFIKNQVHPKLGFEKVVSKIFQGNLRVAFLCKKTNTGAEEK